MVGVFCCLGCGGEYLFSLSNWLVCYAHSVHVYMYTLYIHVYMCCIIILCTYTSLDVKLLFTCIKLMYMYTLYAVHVYKHVL